MQFGITDHIDASGIPPAEQLEQRLRLVELYDRLGFDRYMLTEHHGTPLCLVPSPHLFLAAASQRTSRIRLGHARHAAAAVQPDAADRGGRGARPAQPAAGSSSGWGVASRRRRSRPMGSTRATRRRCSTRRTRS